MKRDDYLQPAYPPLVDETGWQLTTQQGFNKLEAAAIQIAGHILSIDKSWEIMFSDPKVDQKGSTFNNQKLAKNAVRLAKAVLEECQKELDEQKE